MLGLLVAEEVGVLLEEEEEGEEEEQGGVSSITSLFSSFVVVEENEVFNWEKAAAFDLGQRKSSK